MKKTLIAAAVLGLGLLATPASAAGHMPPGSPFGEHLRAMALHLRHHLRAEAISMAMRRA